MSQLPVPNPPNPAPAGGGTPYGQAYSPYHVIEEAMRDAGYLDLLDTPTSEHLRMYITRLQELVNTEQTRGLKLWLQEDVAFTPVEGQQSYAFGPAGDVQMPRPSRIIEGYFTFPTSIAGGLQVRYPLIQLSRRDFNMLGVLNAQGITNSFFVDRQQVNTIVWLWLNPDAFTAMATVHLVCQVQVNQLISLTDTVNFPVEWFSYLHWALADEISTGQPAKVQEKCLAKRADYRMVLEGFDVEDASTLIQPDPRMQYVGGRFA